MQKNKKSPQESRICFCSTEHALQVEIETKRLFIRSYKNEDLEDSVKLYSDEKLAKYSDSGKPRSRREIESFIKDQTKYFDKQQPFGLFSIFLKKESAFIGQMAFIPLEESAVFEMRCLLDRRYHRGFRPEALKAILFDYVRKLNAQGFKWRVHKTVATVDPKDHSYKRLVENIGMTLDKSEERSRLCYFFKHKIIPTHRWQARDYSLNSSTQKEAAAYLVKSLPWKGDEKVIDVGCGDGKITAMMANLVPKGHAIGIDISEEMIHFAKQQFLKEYQNLEFFIQNAEDLNYNREIDVIFSSFAVQWVKNKSSFFKGAYKSLVKSGLLAITVPLGNATAMRQAVSCLIESPEWAPYFTSFSIGVEYYSEDQYRKLLEQHSFKVIHFETVLQNTLFPSRENFEIYVHQWFQYTHALPENLKAPFFKQVIDKYLEIEPLLDDGKVQSKFMRLDMIARAF